MFYKYGWAGGCYDTSYIILQFFCYLARKQPAFRLSNIKV